MRVKDITGKRFGSLTAQERVGSDNWGHSTWRCKCVCGKLTTVASHNLKVGLFSSCGCSRHKARVKF